MLMWTISLKYCSTLVFPKPGKTSGKAKIRSSILQQIHSKYGGLPGEIEAKQIHSDSFEDFRLAISRPAAVQQKLRQNPAERRSAPRGNLVLWSREPPLKLLKVVTEASPMMWSMTLKVVTEASLFGNVKTFLDKFGVARV
ncbi:hypothetical protein IFM89_011356 [Coptis chinensis]|uniref:Uncharacterized protein n=1 Tax=Coptis chinensis TaxID=261450 RepID=A0A835LMQ9_9MAGN|nr:hypothetical protein IFM89_011356 [Coptis chinensis]